MDQKVDTTKSQEIQQRETPLRRLCWTITIEPILVIYSIAFQASLPLQSQFVYQTLLQTFSLQNNTDDDDLYNNGVIMIIASTKNATDPENCNNEPSGSEAQAKAQAAAALMSIVFGLTSIIPAIFSTILLGSYSDRAGRKWGLIPAFVGELVKTTLVMCIIVFELPLMVLVAGCVIQGCCGNAMLVTNTCYSYLADITTHEQRMVRIVILVILLGLSDLIGNLMIGHLIAVIGFLYSYLFLFCLGIFPLFYATLVLKETVQKKPNARLCSFDNLKKAVKVYSRGDVPGRRLILLLTLVIFLFTTMIEQGANGTALDLYLMNVPLCFGSVRIGYFRAFIVVMHCMFDVFAVKLLLPRLKSHGLMLLGCMSLIAYDLFLAQVVAEWMAFVAIVTCLATGMIFSMIRGITSQLVEPHEQGSLFALQGIVTLISSLCGISMYNVIYSKTVRTFSRSVFYIAAAQGALLLLFAGLLVWSIKRFRQGAETADVHGLTPGGDDSKHKGAQLTRF